MQAGLLLAIYVVTTIVVQFLGFAVSQAVNTQWPTMALMTFLVLFMLAFGLAWPIAVRITEWLIRRSGGTVETEQSGGASRRDHYRRT
jgi:Sec-independent protein secretion pathway component TatC